MRDSNGMISIKTMEAVRQISEQLNPCPDLRVQPITSDTRAVVVIWIDGLVDDVRLQDAILAASRLISETKRIRPHRLFAVPGVATHAVETVSEATKALLNGCAITCVDGINRAQAWHVAHFPARSIDRPENEPTLNGPQEAFVDNLSLNLSLLRKRFKTSEFKVETREVGTATQTMVAILYHKAIAKEALVHEVRRRLEGVVVDHVVDINQVREFINDPRFSIFPTTEETERPDRVIAGLLEGRVGLLVDGSPMCMMMPVTFSMFLSSPEDYYMNYSL
ncbi:GerA spore germination protein [Alicyclobacillus sacchari]|nr:GerA spore germination protein [Alicyclobacillus sacchari]